VPGVEALIRASGADLGLGDDKAFYAPAVAGLLDLTVAAKEEALVGTHIRTASGNATVLAAMRAASPGAMAPNVRAILGRAARLEKGWFKSVGLMEEAGRVIVGPDFAQAADPAIGQQMDTIFKWIADGAR